MTAEDDRYDKPITGPPQAGPAYPWEPDYQRPVSPAMRIGRFCLSLVRAPAHWIRENIVEPNRGPKYYWYHRKYEQTLPVDECWLDDYACLYEATMAYKRGYYVDRATLDLLRYRRDACVLWYYTAKDTTGPDDRCQPLIDTYNREEINFHIKYGNMHYQATALDAYNKQKHRMIVERRKALKALEAKPESSENVSS